LIILITPEGGRKNRLFGGKEVSKEGEADQAQIFHTSLLLLSGPGGVDLGRKKEERGPLFF